MDEKFEMLEEQNLFSIKHCQEKSAQIEAEQARAIELEEVKGKEFRDLQQLAIFLQEPQCASRHSKS